MKKTFVQTILLVAISTIFAGGEIKFSVPANPKNPANPKAASKLKPLLRLDKTKETKIDLQRRAIVLPLLFEENKGQIAGNVKFLSRTSGFNFYLTQTEAIFSILNPKRPKKSPTILKMKMLGANTEAEIKGVDETIAKTNYYIGGDSTGWHTDIANYESIRYEKIYEGIDVVFHGAKQNLEYDFHILPQADPNLIRLEFGGMKKMKIERNTGDLIFKFKDIELRHQKPFAYQIIDGEKVAVKINYVLLGKNRVGFKVGNYDSSQELIIDPVIYSSYLGGNRQDSTADVAVDTFGNIYIPQAL